MNLITSVAQKSSSRLLCLTVNKRKANEVSNGTPPPPGALEFVLRN